MTSNKSDKALTHALEDYLETIQQFVDEKGFARVRDICDARGVKSGSVSPAMKRLSDMGLIHHQQGEFVTLTARGEVIARRVQARHDLLIRFFRDFLRVEKKQAEEDACAIEHHLSDASMDGLTRMFEFLQNCPEGSGAFLQRFHDCPIVNQEKGVCDHRCTLGVSGHGALPGRLLTTLKVGERGMVVRVEAGADLRRKLLNMGILPDTEVEVDRTEPDKGVRLLINRHPVRLSLEEAEAVVLE